MMDGWMLWLYCVFRYIVAWPMSFFIGVHLLLILDWVFYCNAGMFL